ncbi:hypothetical protein SDC9_179046 [bioreactor metagenome]|uniref:Uncharacterized protein n=1 Tax=bioreactor metagenome TaxID=1076179 RepID=A0A645GZU7_9ZZZZ
MVLQNGGILPQRFPQLQRRLVDDGGVGYDVKNPLFSPGPRVSQGIAQAGQGFAPAGGGVKPPDSPRLPARPQAGFGNGPA